MEMIETSQSKDVARARRSEGSSCGIVENQISFRNMNPASPTTHAAMITTVGSGTAVARSCSAVSVRARLPMMSGRRGMTRSAMSPPTIDPTPIEAAMKPHALAPPRWSRATIGPATMNAATAKFHIACAPRLSRYHLRTATARMPSTRSVQKCLRSMPVTGGGVSTAGDRALAGEAVGADAADREGDDAGDGGGREDEAEGAGGVGDGQGREGEGDGDEGVADGGDSLAHPEQAEVGLGQGGQG